MSALASGRELDEKHSVFGWESQVHLAALLGSWDDFAEILPT